MMSPIEGRAFIFILYTSAERREKASCWDGSRPLILTPYYRPIDHPPNSLVYSPRRKKTIFTYNQETPCPLPLNPIITTRTRRHRREGSRQHIKAQPLNSCLPFPNLSFSYEISCWSLSPDRLHRLSLVYFLPAKALGFMRRVEGTGATTIWQIGIESAFENGEGKDLASFACSSLRPTNKERNKPFHNYNYYTFGERVKIRRNIIKLSAQLYLSWITIK